MYRGTIIDDLIASVERVQPDAVQARVTLARKTAAVAYETYIYDFTSSKEAIVLGVA